MELFVIETGRCVLINTRYWRSAFGSNCLLA